MGDCTKNFSYAEFHIPAGHDTEAVKHAIKTFCEQILEPIREHFGAAVHITEEGGFRLESTQQAIWDANLRQHGMAYTQQNVAHPGSSRHEVESWLKKGQSTAAADIWIAGVSAVKVLQFALTLQHLGGTKAYDSFTHVDNRPRVGGTVARW